MTRRMNTATREIHFRDYLIVSIGASYGSGQGNPDVPGKPEEFDPDIKRWQKILILPTLYKVTEEAIVWMKNRFKQKFTTIARARKWIIDMDPGPLWLEPNAHRSVLSGHSRGTRLIENTRRGNLITFLTFARSGSTINDGLFGGRTDEDGKPIDGWIDNKGQLDELKVVENLRFMDALIIDIGGVESN